MDGDLQDPPEELGTFLDKWREGYEVVYAVRTKRKEHLLKRIAYKAFYRILRTLSDIEIPLVVRSTIRVTNHASPRSNLCQRNGTGVSLNSAMPLRMRCLSSACEVTRIWRRKVRAIFEKAHSIRLSHEPCLGV